ncbi:MAG: hypothetical protein M0036_26965 [Desulfobacteraceae bacterium]|nr:hypothetical protein [Desulfobacteraceae bacterium]
MRQNMRVKRLVSLVLWFVLSSIMAVATAHAAPSNIQISGRIMLPGDSEDTPVEGAQVSAVKFDPNTQKESTAASITTSSDGLFALSIQVDTDEGAGDPSNIIQIRVAGTDATTQAYGAFVTSCSPFLEVLNLKTPGPPVGDLASLELSPILKSEADAQLAAISAIANEDGVDFTKGILVGSVEYNNNGNMISVAGVHFTISGDNIDGSRTMYMDVNHTWNRQLDRTTSGGPFIIYNIPLNANGWKDVGLQYDLANEANDYLLGVYPWVRVYAYNSGPGYITDAHFEAAKIVTPAQDNPAEDDAGGGGGGGCFIASVGH